MNQDNCAFCLLVQQQMYRYRAECNLQVIQREERILWHKDELMKEGAKLQLKEAQYKRLQIEKEAKTEVSH